MRFTSLILMFLLLFIAPVSFAQSGSGKAFLHVVFEHTASSKPLYLRESVYTTPLGDTFTINKLKYYTSNFSLNGKPSVNGDDNYKLVDLAGETDYIIAVSPGVYSSFGFTLGVDSARNCSGAQSGALDPMKDMFWTWNSGYVMFKLDGTSSSSSADRNRIEHHVGGYRFGQNVATPLNLDFDKALNLDAGDTATLIIHMNLDKYWSGENQISLREDPVCTLPGPLAMKIAQNFRHMFSLRKVKKL